MKINMSCYKNLKVLSYAQQKVYLNTLKNTYDTFLLHFLLWLVNVQLVGSQLYKDYLIYGVYGVKLRTSMKLQLWGFEVYTRS